MKGPYRYLDFFFENVICITCLHVNIPVYNLFSIYFYLKHCLRRWEKQSWSHRIIYVARDLWRSSSPTSYWKQNSKIDVVAQGLSHLTFDNLKNMESRMLVEWSWNLIILNSWTWPMNKLLYLHIFRKWKKIWGMTFIQLEILFYWAAKFFWRHK